MDVVYVDADDSDKEFFRSLNEICYRELIEALFGNWDSHVENEKFEAKWSESNFRKVDGRLAGGVWVDDEGSHHQLREIQLVPEFRNRGIGSQVIEQCVKDARCVGKPLRLRVLETNPALRLYERLGFRVCDSSPEARQVLMER